MSAVPQRTSGLQEHSATHPELIAKNAQAIYQQAVVARVMPMANSTQMTDDERESWVPGSKLVQNRIKSPPFDFFA